jgi:hypothetical protein
MGKTKKYQFQEKISQFEKHEKRMRNFKQRGYFEFDEDEVENLDNEDEAEIWSDWADDFEESEE